MGVSGPLTSSMIASARCLVTPNFKVQSILRAVLRDEIMTWHKKVSAREKVIPTSIESQISCSQTQEDMTNANSSGEITMDGEALINGVNKAVSAIMGRLQSKIIFILFIIFSKPWIYFN